jgi:iron complex outermembrane receptor protein
MTSSTRLTKLGATALAIATLCGAPGMAATPPLVRPDGSYPTVPLAKDVDDFRFDGNATYGNNRLPGIPAMALRSEVLWAPAPGWYVGPTLEWSSKTAVDMANTLFADPFTLWGLKAGMRIDKGASFFVQARNLGNRKYAATTGVIADARSLDSAQFLPGDGRSVFAGIDWRL